jgi:hypothetical protein
MADMQKKMAAALAAVNAYLQMEEAAAAQAALQRSPVPVNLQSCWSQSGRQDMMTMRRLIQLRTFSGRR